MCKFFSFISDGKGNFFYANAEQRKNKVLDTPDSHSCLATHYFGEANSDDSINKYEYCFFRKEFTIDQLNVEDDSKLAETFVKSLNVKEIVPQLIKTELNNPLSVSKKVEITDRHIQLLKQWDSVGASVGASVRASVGDSVWASVGASVRASVRASVWASVGASVRASVWDSVWASVGDSVWASVGASVRASVWASVGASVRASVWDSVWANISSMFLLKKEDWKYCNFEFDGNPFQSCIDLWNDGLVPSFDGNTWRLHSGKKADIVFEITKVELEKR